MTGDVVTCVTGERGGGEKGGKIKGGWDVD